LAAAAAVVGIPVKECARPIAEVGSLNAGVRAFAIKADAILVRSRFIALVSASAAVVRIEG
jgi:hypothetical protein